MGPRISIAGEVAVPWVIPNFGLNFRRGPCPSNGLGADVERDALVAHSPDVVALQEVRDLDAYARELKRSIFRKIVGSRTDDGRLGLIVGARWPMKRLNSVKFTIPATESDLYRKPPGLGDVDVRMLSVKIDREKEPFELHVVHVPHGSGHGWRKIDTFRSVFAWLATSSELPRILCGDFNEPRSDTKDGVSTWAEENRYARKDPNKWGDGRRERIVGLGGIRSHGRF